MIDILVFAVILIFMWKGYERRFSREFTRLIALVCSVVIALIFYEVLGTALNSTPLPKALGGLTSDHFLQKITGNEIDSDTVNQIFGAITHEKNKTLIVGQFMAKFISFLILFIAAYIALRKIFRKTKLFQKIRVVHQVSPALGGLIGVLRAIVFVYIAIALLVICEPVIPTEFVKTEIEKTQIARTMYEDNYIANIVAQRDFLSLGESEE